MGVSTPVVLIAAAATQALIAKSIFSDLLPSNAITYVLIRSVAINFALYSLYVVLIYPQFVSPLRHLPSVKGISWLSGHHVTAIYERPPAQRLLRWAKEIPNNGFIRFPGLFGRELVLVTSPKALGEVLVTHSYAFTKPANGRAFLRKFLGNGLVVAEGDEHRFQRRNTTPVFSFRHVKNLYPVLWQKAVALVERVDKDGEGQETQKLDLGTYSMKVAMDAIGVAALGRELNTLSNAQDPLNHNYEELLEPSTPKVIYSALCVVFGPDLVHLLPWEIPGIMNGIIANLRQICRQVVVERKSMIEKKDDERVDLLSSLIRSDNFGDDELVDQMLTFLASGHETTAATFEWAVYMLSQHPSIQTRLRTELRSIALNINPQDPHTPELDTKLEALPLLNGVLNETLRLFPAVAVTQREAQEDLTILSQPFPRGTLMIICPWSVNRSTDLWGPEAEMFRPERWIDGETGRPNNHGGAPNNYAFLSFLHGPKSCIGLGLARAELRCLVAAWVLAFEFSMQDPLEVVIPSGAITVKPKNGLHLNVSRAR